MADNKVLIKVGSPNYPTVYTLGSFKGKKNFDIRKYYIEKKSNELAPTRKGISLNKESFNALLSIIENQQNTIQDWFNSGEVLPSNDLLKNLKIQADKVQKEMFEAKEFNQKQDKLSDNSFFKVKYDGDKRIMIFNENHILLKYLEENLNDEKLIKILTLILLSFQHTVDLYDDDEKLSVKEFVDDLKDNWSLVLKNYIKKL